MSTRKDEGKGSRFGLIAFAIIIVVVIGIVALLNVTNTTTYHADTSSSTSQIVSEDVADPYDDIRNRENIKRQQELIVLETFLNEERTRVEKEKADAIAKFDSEIAELETKLEGVRGEKLSFQ